LLLPRLAHVGKASCAFDIGRRYVEFEPELIRERSVYWRISAMETGIAARVP